jgi:hypothetical protein
VRVANEKSFEKATTLFFAGADGAAGAAEAMAQDPPPNVTRSYLFKVVAAQS